MFEDWKDVVYLLMNLMFRFFGITFLEQFDIWKGDGQNGKGLLTKLLRTLLGSYYRETSMGLLADRRSDPNKPSPAWMALRGSRIIAITEAEGATTIQSSNLKQLRDPASVFESRGLRENLVEWSPSFGLFL